MWEGLGWERERRTWRWGRGFRLKEEEEEKISRENGEDKEAPF